MLMGDSHRGWSRQNRSIIDLHIICIVISKRRLGDLEMSYYSNGARVFGEVEMRSRRGAIAYYREPAVRMMLLTISASDLLSHSVLGLYLPSHVSYRKYALSILLFSTLLEKVHRMISRFVYTSLLPCHIFEIDRCLPHAPYCTSRHHNTHHVSDARRQLDRSSYTMTTIIDQLWMHQSLR